MILLHAVTLLCTLSQGRTQEYTIRALPTPGEISYPEVTGMNDHGDVVGIAWNSDGVLLGFRWVAGTVELLQGLSELPEARPFAINNAGTAVGLSPTRAPDGYHSPTLPVGAIWPVIGPVLEHSLLPRDPYAPEHIQAINNRGQLLGASAGSGGGYHGAYIHTPGGGDRLFFHPHDANDVLFPIALNDAGEVLLQAGSAEGVYLYGSSVTRIQYDNEFPPENLILKNSGRIAGTLYARDPWRFVATTWDRYGVQTELAPHIGYIDGFAFDQNEDGSLIVGSSTDRHFQTSIATVWRNGIPVDLNYLTGANLQGWRLLRAQRINAAGQIAGVGERHGVPTFFIVETVTPPEIAMQVADRDDPTASLEDLANAELGQPIYAGIGSTGDLVSWYFAEDVIAQNFAWTARPANPELPQISGPEGANADRWTLGLGDLHWAPGKYDVTCEITTPAGLKMRSSRFVEVGWRSRELLVVGQVRPIDDFELSDTERAELQDALAEDILQGTEIGRFLAGMNPLTRQLIKGRITAFDVETLTSLWFATEFLTGWARTSRLPVSRKAALWMVQHMLNSNPDTNTLGLSLTDEQLNRLQQEESYRMLTNYRIKYTLTETGNMAAVQTVGKEIAKVGPTKISLPKQTHALFQILKGWLGGFTNGYQILIPTQANPHHGTKHLHATGTAASLYASGRVGFEAHSANRRLFGRDVPYIFSQIIIGVDGEGRDELNRTATSVDKLMWTWGGVTGDTHFNEITVYERDFERGTFNRIFHLPIGGGAGMLEAFVFSTEEGVFPHPAPTPLR